MRWRLRASRYLSKLLRAGFGYRYISVLLEIISVQLCFSDCVSVSRFHMIQTRENEAIANESPNGADGLRFSILSLSWPLAIVSTYQV
jgi:hypothetical protein